MGKMKDQRIRLHPELCKYIKINSALLNKRQTQLLPKDFKFFDKNFKRFKIE